MISIYILLYVLINMFLIITIILFKFTRWSVLFTLNLRESTWVQIEADPSLERKQAVYRHPALTGPLPSDRGDRLNRDLEAEDLCPTLSR